MNAYVVTKVVIHVRKNYVFLHVLQYIFMALYTLYVQSSYCIIWSHHYHKFSWIYRYHRATAQACNFAQKQQFGSLHTATTTKYNLKQYSMLLLLLKTIYITHSTDTRRQISSSSSLEHCKNVTGLYTRRLECT